MKVVLQYRASPGLRQRIAALDFPTVIVDEVDKDMFLREMHDADVLLRVLEPVTAAVIDAAPRLKLIQKIGIGVNTIDLGAARRRGVAVCNMPGTNTQAVAEMTLVLMLATLRGLARLDDLTRIGKGWELDPKISDDFGELSGRTVGGQLWRRRQAPGADAASDRRKGGLHQPSAGRGFADRVSAVPGIAAGRRFAVPAFAAHCRDDGDDRRRGFCGDEARQRSDQYCSGPAG
jgi:D-isomer specific 2-hydroxyacid dehydrogenase, catalytic domain